MLNVTKELWQAKARLGIVIGQDGLRLTNTIDAKSVAKTCDGCYAAACDGPALAVLQFLAFFPFRVFPGLLRPNASFPVSFWVFLERPFSTFFGSPG